MFKNTLLSSILLSFLLVPYSFGDNVVASKGYVDTQIDTTQVKIPAAGTAGVPLGTTVMTYTSTSGEIGERGIYDGSSNYDASNDSDKIITASALKGAMDSLPTVSTNKLTCANTGVCNLWTIVDQTAYGNGGGGNSGASPMHDYLLTYYGSCADDNGSYGLDGSYSEQGPCDDSTFAEMTPGDWCARMLFEADDECTYVIGNSVCSTVVAVGEYYGTGYGYGSASIPSNQSQINTDYASNVASVPNSNPVGRYCYCRLTKANGNSAVSSWAYAYTFDTPGECAGDCAGICGAAAYTEGGSDSFAYKLFETVP